MDRHELWFRASAAGRRQAGHVAYVTRPPQWRRDRVTRALAADPSTRPAIACLQRGDWMGAHEALMQPLRNAPTAVRPRSGSAVAAGPHGPRTASGRARRCDPTRRSGGRGKIRSPRLSGPDVWQRWRARTDRLAPRSCASAARATGLLEPGPLSRALLRRPQGRLGAQPSPVVADRSDGRTG